MVILFLFSRINVLLKVILFHEDGGGRLKVKIKNKKSLNLVYERQK
jgi:hypothetical protein